MPFPVRTLAPRASPWHLARGQADSASLAGVRMRILRAIAAAIAASVVVACSTNAITPVEPDFRGVSPPQSGFARLYLLRPAFSELSHADSPIFVIDGKVSVKLAFGSYADLQLSQGRHTLAVRPSPGDADIWKGDFEFAVAPDTKYFVAVWNDVKREAPPRVPGLIPFLIVKSLTTDKNIALRIELVSEQDALPVLKESRYAEANAQLPGN